MSRHRAHPFSIKSRYRAISRLFDLHWMTKIY